MVSVRDIQEADIALIDAYWQSLAEDDLKRMCIDRTLLPSSQDFRARLTRLLDTPIMDRAADPLIWEVDGKAVGFTNLNNIERGKQADVHLHLWDPGLRGKGLGRSLFAKSIQKYFQRHGLPKIVCQPASTNPGPTGMMRALGIPVTHTYRTKPSVICFEHEVNRYEIDEAILNGILKRSEVQHSYDVVADEYVRRIYDELSGKPLDRELLTRFVKSVPSGAIISDLGSGPGHVSRYLKDHGGTVIGVDLSPGMLERARNLNPDIEFHGGDMLDLSSWYGAWSGIVSFYSIVNIEPGHLLRAFQEMYRSLSSNGRLLLAFHIGEDTIHLDEWWNLPVSVDFFFFQTSDVVRLLGEAGFEIEDVIERDPYPEVEHQSRRAYIFCKKPKS